MVFEESFRLMRIEWKQEITSEQYRVVFNTALEFGRNNRVEYFLSDIRNQGVVIPTDRKWFEEVVIPHAVKLGLLTAAIIFSGNVYQKFYLNHIYAKIRKYNLPLKFFTSDSEAEEWYSSLLKK